MKRAALFDMDRTLVRTDTATLYTRRERDQGRASLSDVLRVAFWMAQYSLGVIDAARVVRKVLADFRGSSELEMTRSCEEWFRGYVLPEVLEKGREAVRRHQSRGELVVIVTGATRYAAEPLARELGIEHVACTELAVDAAGCFTGEVVEPLCYGVGKIARTERLAEQYGFEIGQAAFYTDSITDLPLLERVAMRVAVNPDRRLKRVAERRGWRIERW